jgi:hypothetical protein
VKFYWAKKKLLELREINGPINNTGPLVRGLGPFYPSDSNYVIGPINQLNQLEPLIGIIK